MRREWTTKQVGELKILYKSGLSRTQCAEVLRLPKSTVKSAICRFNLYRNDKVKKCLTLTGASAILCAAHRGHGYGIHGHTWEVTVWRKDNGTSAEDLQSELQTLLSEVDHRELPEELIRGEAIARWVGTKMNAHSVEVRRPLERIYARWENRS
jgi:DNA invertase Pin-like site-specific DNA recombinase